MDDLQTEKLMVGSEPYLQRPARMMSLSSRPIRVAVILSVLALIYFVQPFTGHPDLVSQTAARASTSASSSSSSSWPAWSRGKSQSSISSLSALDGADPAGEGAPRMRQATMIYDTDKFNAVYERSVGLHIKHGQRWNVPTHILRHDVVDAGFFNKPAFLLGLVIQEMSKPYGDRADWIVWLDADTIVLNSAVPWSIFLPPADMEDIHVLGTKDFNGFNAGVMLLRVHEWTVKMLSEVIALRQLRPEVEYMFYDQGATNWVMNRPGYEEHLIYQPHDWWNVFGPSGDPFATDHWTLHFAGVDCCGQPEKKTTVMGRWLDLVENHPETYEKPLSNTTYPRQVADYWKLVKAGRSAYAKADKWRDDHEMNPAPLDDAMKKLKEVLLRNADSASNVTSAIEAVDSALAKEDGSANNKES